MTKRIQLKKAPEKMAAYERTMRYDVLFNGKVFDTLYYNLKGYVGYLPTPEGRKLDIGERSISTYRKEIRRLNNEFDEHLFSLLRSDSKDKLPCFENEIRETVQHPLYACSLEKKAKTSSCTKRSNNRFLNVFPSALNDAEQASVIDLAVEILKNRYRKGKKITSPDELSRYLQLFLSEYEDELFGVVFLDVRHHLLCMEILYRGTVDGAAIYPRGVVKSTLKHNAASVVLFHNHPSGDAAPSSADKKITRRIKDALGVIDVRVLDHIIVGCENTTSFSKNGLI